MSRLTSLSLRAALFLLAIGCKTVPRYQGNGEQEVLNAEHEWVNVTLRQDADAFASFLDNDYVALNSSGSFTRKPGWTHAIREKTTHYDVVELSNLQVRFPRADVAVVTGDFIQKGMTGTRDNSMVGRYINTWVRKHDKWQLVASGFAPMPKPK